MKKKPKSTKRLTAQPQSVIVRKPEQSARFRQALNDSSKPKGRPPFKLNEIVRVLGDEFNYFIDACCDRQVTTRSIMDALRSLGVVISYQTMLTIRKQIEGENRWFYDMIDDLAGINQDDEGVQSERL